MPRSTLLGADVAPTHPSGEDAELLGPSDNSDSGSDTVGTHEAQADSDAEGTGERSGVDEGGGREGGDILPDRIENIRGEESLPETDLEDVEFTDLEADNLPEAPEDEEDKG